MNVPTYARRAALLIALALACRSGLPDARGAPAPPPTAPSAPEAMNTPPESLSLELVLPQSVRAGAPVPITLRVENQAQRTLDLYLRGRVITFDVFVARPDGRVVWQRLEDEIIPAILQIRTLAPGERLRAEATWDQRNGQGRPVGPGEYSARGLLLSEGEPLETPAVRFRIIQP